MISQLSSKRLGKTPDVTLKACIVKSRKGNQLELKAIFRTNPKTIGLYPRFFNYKNRLESSTYIQAWNWVKSQLYKVDFTPIAPIDTSVTAPMDTTPAATIGRWDNHWMGLENPTRFDDLAWYSKFREYFQGPITKIPVTEVLDGLLGTKTGFKVFRFTLKVNMAAGRVSNMFTLAYLEKQYNTKGNLEDTPNISTQYREWKQTFGSIDNLYTAPKAECQEQNDRTLKLWLRGESGTPVH
jgi:hypothetical protein